MVKRRSNAKIEWLLGQLLEQGYRIDQRGAASQLAYSSFDSAPGAGIKETDPETGNVVANFGTQFDGSHGPAVFTGPIPPQPSPALTRPGTGTLAAGWDGVFVNAAGARDYQIIPTMDWTHVEVHISQEADFTAESAETIMGTINTARGGWVAAVTGPGVFYVRLVARSAAGKKSAASPAVAVSVEGFNTDALRDEWEAADAVLNAALTQNAQQQQQLANTLAQLKDTTVPGLASDLAGAKNRLTAAEGTITSTTNLATATSTELTAATTRLSAAEASLLTKGTSDVVYSATAPAAALRKTTTLWIDTSGTPPLNSPKRWTTGTTWVAVTDKAVIDAAAAAATAKQAADDAAAAAATAAQTAASAVTLANGKNTRRFSATGPGTATGVAGDVWSRRDGTGQVVENWLHDGTTWTTYKLGDGALNNLDVGKLTAGSATILEAVAAKIAAGTASIQTADIGNLFVTGNSALNTVTAQRIAANVGAYLELEVGKLTAGTASLGTAVADKLFSEIFSTRKLSAEQVLIGDGGNRIGDPEFADIVVNANRLSTNNATRTGTPLWTFVDAAGSDPAGFRRVLNANIASRFDFWAGPQPVNPATDSAGMIPVKAGERVTFFGFVSNTLSTTWSWSVKGWNPATGATSTGNVGTASVLAAGKSFIRAEYTVPAGISHITPGLQATTPTNTSASNTNTLTIWGGAFVRKLGGEPLVLFTDTDVSGAPHDLKVTVAARNISTFAANDEKVPGLWFSTRKKDQTDVPPTVEAGVVSTGKTSGGVQIHSSAAQAVTASDWSRVFADTGMVGMEARRAPFEAFPARGVQQLTATTFSLHNTTAGAAAGTQRAQVRHDGDGLLRVYGASGVEIRGDAPTTPITTTGALNHTGSLTINGSAPVLDEAPPAPTNLTLMNNFTHFTGVNWSGVKLYRHGRIVRINGVIARATAWAWNTQFALIPAALRPAFKISGESTSIEPDGTAAMITPGNAGSQVLIEVWWTI